METLVASCYLDFSYMFTNEIELIYDGLCLMAYYHSKQSYKKFVSALTLFQAIINGRFFADILKENRVYQQILLNMIHNFRFKYSSERRGKGRNGISHRRQDSNTMVMNAAKGA